MSYSVYASFAVPVPQWLSQIRFNIRPQVFSSEREYYWNFKLHISSGNLWSQWKIDHLNRSQKPTWIINQLFWCLPFGASGCKNSPAPFSGQTLYKATKPGFNFCLFFVMSFGLFVHVCYWYLPAFVVFSFFSIMLSDWLWNNVSELTYLYVELNAKY